MSNTELTHDQLEACAGGAAWIPAGYIIAKEGAKAIKFYSDLADNLSEGKNLGAAIVSAGYSSGTIE